MGRWGRRRWSCLFLFSEVRVFGICHIQLAGVSFSERFSRISSLPSFLHLFIVIVVAAAVAVAVAVVVAVVVVVVVVTVVVVVILRGFD